MTLHGNPLLQLLAMRKNSTSIGLVFLTKSDAPDMHQSSANCSDSPGATIARSAQCNKPLQEGHNCKKGTTQSHLTPTPEWTRGQSAKVTAYTG
jgi:hypothetical protein